MSEQITHVGVCDDSRRLAVRSEAVTASVKDVLDRQPEMCRYGSGANSGGKAFTMSALERYRDRWPPDSNASERRVAFVLGRMAHHAADGFFKSALDEFTDRENRSGDEAEVYQDSVVLEKVYDGVSVPPFERGLLSLDAAPAADAIDADLAETYVGDSHKNSLLQLSGVYNNILQIERTDSDGVRSLRSRLFSLNEVREKFYIDIDRIREVYTDPDSEKYNDYIEEPNFYDEADPVLDVLETIRSGEPVDSSAIHDAATAEQDSQYGTVVADAYRRIERGGSFLVGDIDMDEVIEYTGHDA